MSQQAPPRGQPAPPTEPRKGLEVDLLPFIASIVGMLLVAGIIGGVLWFTREGEDEAVATTTAATQPGGAVSGAPTIEVETDGDVLTYTVDYDRYEPGDTYRLVKGPSPESLGGAEPWALRDGETTHESNVGQGEKECARVQVRRGSQISSWSTTVCEEGAR